MDMLEVVIVLVQLRHNKSKYSNMQAKIGLFKHVYYAFMRVHDLNDSAMTM